jgi:hypothetical protein
MPALAFNQPAADEHEAGIGAFESRSDAKGGRFATAGLTKKAEDLAAGDVQVDAVHGKACAETLGDAPEGEPV